MSKLSHLWDRPIILCAYKQFPCGLGFLADLPLGDRTPPLFVCAAGFTVAKGPNFHENCKKTFSTTMQKHKTRTRDGLRKQSRKKKHEKPLWMSRGMEVYK